MERGRNFLKTLLSFLIIKYDIKNILYSINVEKYYKENKCYYQSNHDIIPVFCVFQSFFLEIHLHFTVC